MNGGAPRRAWSALAGIALAGGAAAATRIRANDLWWHLATGEWIVSNHAVPRADPFTFTSAGTPWIDHGWLWQIGAWLLHRAGGETALAALKVACAIAIGAAAFAALRRSGWHAHSASVLVIAALWSARFRFTDRPDMASLALLAVFMALLTGVDRPAPKRALAAALLCCLWANVHAGVLVAPVLALTAAAGSLVGALRSRPRVEEETHLCDSRESLLMRARGEMLVAISAAAGLLANPYGPGLLRVPFLLGRILADPRLVNPEWLPPRPESFPLFQAVLAGALLVCAFRVLRLGDPLAWRPMLLIGATGALALTGVRHLGVFFTVLPFAAAAGSAPASMRRKRRRAPVATEIGEAIAGWLRWIPERWAILWGIAGAALMLAGPAGGGSVTGTGVEADRFPIEETDWVEAHLPAPRRMYNDVAHGGYLIWRLYPGDQAFIDGRNEVHAELLREIAASLDDGRAWSALLEKHGVQAAMLRYREERIGVRGSLPQEARSFSALHFPRTSWALVHWGDTAMVFVRRGGAAGDLIPGNEYRSLNPEDWEYQLARCERGDADLQAGILEDLQRRLSEGPSKRARRLLDTFRRIAAPAGTGPRELPREGARSRAAG